MTQDALLHEIVQAAKKRLEHEIDALNAKIWSDISTKVNEQCPENYHSSTDCKARYESLVDGTALPPIELDPNQEGRARQREERIAAVDQARANKIARQDAQRRAKEEEAAREAEERATRRRLDLEAQRNRKEMEIARRAAAKARQHARARNQERQDKLMAIEQWTAQKRRLELEILKPFLEAEQQLIQTAKASGGQKKRKRPHAEALPANQGINAVDTPSTLENPRSIMSLNELSLLLTERNLPRRRVDETQAQLVVRLAAADASLNRQQLIDLLRSEFIPHRGSKTELIHRLQQHDADKKSALGKSGVKPSSATFIESCQGSML